MSTIGFLLLGVVLSLVLIIALALVGSLAGVVAVKLGANYPNSGTRTQITVLVMLVAIAAGFWLSWQIVM